MKAEQRNLTINKRDNKISKYILLQYIKYTMIALAVAVMALIVKLSYNTTFNLNETFYVTGIILSTSVLSIIIMFNSINMVIKNAKKGRLK